MITGHGIHRKQQLHAAVLRLLDHLERIVHLVGLEQRRANLAALRLDERIGHAAADDDGIGDVQQVVDDADLGGDLAAA